MNIKTILIGAAILAAVINLGAQTNIPPSNPPEILGTNSQSDLGLIGRGLLGLAQGVIDKTPTNFAIAPYGTYVVNAKKFGGGIAGVYNVNNFFGAVVAVDYIDQFLGVSGGVQIQYPIRPLSYFSLTNFTVTPFVISAVGTSLQGAGASNGGVQTIQTAGMDAHFGHLWGGQFLVGGAYGTRSGAGAYSGGYINAFIGWKKGF